MQVEARLESVCLDRPGWSSFIQNDSSGIVRGNRGAKMLPPRLGYAGSENRSERQRNSLDLQAEVHERMNPNQNGGCRSETWYRRIFASDHCKPDTAQCQQNYAQQQHRSEHQPETLEDLQIGVMRLLPCAPHAHRVVAVHREDIRECAVAVTEEGNIKD